MSMAPRSRRAPSASRLDSPAMGFWSSTSAVNTASTTMPKTRVFLVTFMVINPPVLSRLKSVHPRRQRADASGTDAGTSRLPTLYLNICRPRRESSTSEHSFAIQKFIRHAHQRARPFPLADCDDDREVVAGRHDHGSRKRTKE